MPDNFIKWVGDKAMQQGGNIPLLNKVEFDYSEYLGNNEAKNREALSNLIESLQNDNQIFHTQLDTRYQGPLKGIKLHTISLTEAGAQRYEEIKNFLEESKKLPSKVGF